MSLPRGVRRLLRLGTVLRRADRELEDELDHHFDAAVHDFRTQGFNEAEALARAHARFGDERAYRQALRRIGSGRVTMGTQAERFDSMVRTVTVALRRLRRAPGFTAAIVSILALGIGANAVMFGVVDRLLLSPPRHVVDADAVKLIHVRRTIFNGERFTGQSITFPDYRDFADVGAFAATGAYTGSDEETIGRGDEARQARVAGASASLFPLLGVQPAAGRFFAPDEDAVDATPTAVLAHEYWEREFGAAPSALGSTLDIGEGTYTIIGVAPPGFTGATLEPVDIWLPLMTRQGIENGTDWVENRGWYWMQAAVRLSPSATVEAATAEATAAHRAGRASQIAEDRYDEAVEVVVAPIIAARGPSPTGEAQVARWLGGVSAVVLLIACFNVANLLLARAVHTRREMAVRLTLGVGRRRLISELLVESVALALLGAAAAVLVAWALGGTIHQALLPDVAYTGAAQSGRLLVFTLITTLVAGVMTGIVPALQASRTQLAETLRAGGRGVAGGRSRTRTLLLIGQAALSVILLVGAGLFVRSLRQAESLDLGFDAHRLAVLTLEWNETLPGTDRRAIYDQVLERVRRVPGVRSAGLTYTIPFRSSISLGQPRVPGLDSIPRHHNGGPYVNKVGSGYFEAMGLTLLQGRGFEPGDDAPGAPPVAVVTEAMARAIWPAGDALGSCMMIGSEADTPCTEIVGVAENHRRQALVEDDPHFLYYLNQEHPGFVGPPQGIMIGSEGDPASVIERIRSEARGTSGQIRFVGLASMADYVEPELRSWKLGASMFTVFGFLALVVAGWGLYSVLAFDVALRGHELGVRAALGAGVPRIVRLVLRQALALVGAGIVLGLVGAGVAARFIEPLLFRVSGTDAPTYAFVALTLMVVAAVAGSLPAWRATRVDPRRALQAD